MVTEVSDAKEKEAEENVVVYRVNYEVKYKKEGIGPKDSGKDTIFYTLIRKDKTSNWLIDGIGY